MSRPVEVTLKFDEDGESVIYNVFTKEGFYESSYLNQDLAFAHAEAVEGYIEPGNIRSELPEWVKKISTKQ